MLPDAIVVGAGCAGLALAANMLEHAPEAAITIVSSPGRDPDKLWSWWDDAAAIDGLFPDVPRRVWDTLRVTHPGGDRIERLGSLRYATIRSVDYVAALRERLLAAPRVRWVEGRVQTIIDGARSAEVVVDSERLRAPWVFQSVMPCPADRGGRGHFPIRQRFVGWIVETEHAVFDPGVPTLMDFCIEQRDPASFLYVLPFSTTEALFELTAFARPERSEVEDDEAELRQLVDARVRGPYRIVHRESAVLPMEDRQWSPRWGQRIFNLGRVGGMLKPSTGYAFARTQRQVRHLADSWASSVPLAAPSTSWRHRVYDRALLAALYDAPAGDDLGRRTFSAMFRAWSLPELLRFLDERTSLREELGMMRRLPPQPFASAVPRALLAGWSDPKRTRSATPSGLDVRIGPTATSDPPGVSRAPRASSP